MKENFNDLYSFLNVAREGSFTKAALKLNVTQSALSQTISQLEQRLGVQLFTRTTRKVSLTHAGEALFLTASQSFDLLENQLDNLVGNRENPKGKVRISASQHVIQYVLLPKLAHFKNDYPNIQLELISENQLTDIVSERYDAGVRLGNDVQEGMIAVKIGQEIPMAVVATPDYFAQYGTPVKPQDLEKHNCIGYRLGSGGLYAWDFQHRGKPFVQKVQGQWVLSDSYCEYTAVKLGLGLCYLPKELVENELNSGELVEVLTNYSISLPACYLYYPHRNISPALRLVVESLKV
ncbi:LysR family transcriptional regulator [Caviibacterium pharyngocola]|uniref:LysR family transcriptional regulator n=1 Tax=Caviibacterium pharyngocola TaxID=28159 RepID=A0A2M8RUC1_9PAST|nr:LysR family transcriptional regulator [Caviibacterium pharyngocola]PJG82484.1 LysR family transcriptional regulator [Caviibacterium pharyngocola]